MCSWGTSRDPALGDPACAGGSASTTVGREQEQEGLGRLELLTPRMALECATAVAAELVAQGRLQLTVFQVKHNKL